MKPSSLLSWLLLLLGLLAAPALAHGGSGPDQNTLKRLFPQAESFVTKPLQLSATQRKAIETRLGKPLESHDLKATAYVATAKGRSLGVIFLTDAHLKEGLVDVLVGVDTKGKLSGVALQHSPVARLAQPAYLDQYKKLTTHSAFQLGKDVQPLSGQPAASRLLAEAVRKGAVVIDIAFLGGK